MNGRGIVGQGVGAIDGVGVWLCVHHCVYVCQNVGVCDSMCV